MVVAGAADGTALLLQPTAACVWRALAEWTDDLDLERVLADQYPQVDAGVRVGALETILEMLLREGILEHRTD